MIITCNYKNVQNDWRKEVSTLSSQRAKYRSYLNNKKQTNKKKLYKVERTFKYSHGSLG